MTYIHEDYTDYLCEAWNKIGRPIDNNDLLELGNARMPFLKYMKQGL